jgi:ketosteroid isomerase-like protein
VPDANAESLRVFWDRWSRGEDNLSLLDPDVVFEDDNLPDHAGEAYHGHEGVMRATERWLEPFEYMNISLERIVGEGDRFVTVHQTHAKARHSGLEFEGPLAYAWTFRDGKVIHFRSYRDVDEALAAAGLEA